MFLIFLQNYDTAENVGEELDPDDPTIESNEANRDQEYVEGANNAATGSLEEDGATQNRCEVPKTVARKQFVSPKKHPPKRRHPEDPRIEEAFNILKSKAGESKEKDECGIFADYMMAKMRKMNSRERAVLQHEIHGLLLRAEMSSYTSPTSSQSLFSSRSSPHSQLSSLHNSPMSSPQSCYNSRTPSPQSIYNAPPSSPSPSHESQLSSLQLTHASSHTFDNELSITIPDGTTALNLRGYYSTLYPENAYE